MNQKKGSSGKEIQFRVTFIASQKERGKGKEREKHENKLKKRGE